MCLNAQACIYERIVSVCVPVWVDSIYIYIYLCAHTLFKCVKALHISEMQGLFYGELFIRLS